MPKSDLRAVLNDVRASLVPFYGRGSGMYHPVLVGPRLSFAMTPRPRSRLASGEGQRDDLARKRERLAFLLSGGQGPATGLVEGSESDATPAEGPKRSPSQGLTRHGARVIENFCALVRQDRGLYAMWTVTLPPDAAMQLNAIQGGFRRFVSVVRRRFSEALARACARERSRRPIEPHWAFVVELQQSGIPHLHVVFRCRSRMGRPWLLNTGGLDALIARALVVVTGNHHDVVAAGNVQALRKDPGSYLSKYLRKSAANNHARLRDPVKCTVNLSPGHWWGISTTARAFLVCYQIELPCRFVGWLSLLWPQLVAARQMRARIWQPPDPNAPRIVVGGWQTAAKFQETIKYLADVAEFAVASPLSYGNT